MPHFSKIALLLCAGLLYGTGQALAATPESTTATYGDWTLHCTAPAAKAGVMPDTPKVCEIEQNIQLRKTGQTILKIALGQPKKGAPVSMVFEVPTGVLLRPGISLSLGNAPKAKPDLVESYVRCTAQSCVADGEVTATLSTQLLAGKTMIVEFVNGNGQRVRVPTSLNGFASAYHALFPDAAAKKQ